VRDGNDGLHGDVGDASHGNGLDVRRIPTGWGLVYSHWIQGARMV